MFRSSPTTKILHIVRHGKALHGNSAISDINRPLIERGIINTETMGKQLSAKCDVPELIISSYAARALHTALILARRLEYPAETIRINENLYLEGRSEVFDILKNLPNEINSVMIVGHNPDVTYMANAYARKDIGDMPTSGVVTICFKTDRWSEIGTAETSHMTHYPKQLEY